MANVSKITTVWITAPDKQGTWANITSPLAEANINIWGFNGWQAESQVQFVLWAADNANALSVLKKAGWRCEEREAIACEWPNKAGEMASWAKKAANAGVDLTYLWATPGKSQENAWVVLCSTDNKALWKALTA